jgi:hypothetical protein
MASRKSGTHGRSSSDDKMGRAQDVYRGSWVERYQRRVGVWADLSSEQNKTAKHRAAKKRRGNNKKAVQRDLEAS